MSHLNELSTALQPAQLVLKTGELFQGMIPATQKASYYGEVVFNTGMTGYVETLTDPSYAGQLLCFSYPLIGNYGVTTKETWESDRIQVAGVILSEFSACPYHHEAVCSLQTWLNQANIPWIAGIDTRALVHRLRDVGVVMGAITTQQTTHLSFPDYSMIDWVSQVSIKTPQYYDPNKTIANSKRTLKIIAVDCGLKQNSLRLLRQFPWQIKRVPFNYDYTQEEYDGVFISNGPGDPTACLTTITILKKAMKIAKPIFGICLGSQLMALATGAKTYKLPTGHRGQNQPCLFLAKDHAYLTSQNHGFAVDENSLPSDWEVTFRNLNDQTVAGIAHKTSPFFSVQFHPEAAPGPLDTQWLFKIFWEQVRHNSHTRITRSTVKSVNEFEVKRIKACDAHLL
jgi:carbamoyl-phosphate synthase small subunit